MGKNNVFLDVDVPKVVQDKMDAAFLIIKTERENTMKKEQTIEKRTENTAADRKRKRYVKQRKLAAIVVAAACMAAVVAAVVVKGRGTSPISDETEFLSNNSSNEILFDIGGDNSYEDNMMSAAEETFTLTIMGAELEKDKPVQLVSDASFITEKYAGTWIVAGIETGGVSYCINVPFTCRGNDIESITYSVNNGAFQIVQPVGDSIIVDGQLYDGELNTGRIGGHDEEDEEEDGAHPYSFEAPLYQSFTLDYQKQSDENTWINICNERPDNGELESLIFGYNTLENKNLGIQKMLDNTIITCTVHYADGTSKSVDVLVNSCIMTCAEAGAEIKDDPNREEIFITFELK